MTTKSIVGNKFKSGCWSYAEDRMVIAFNPEKRDRRPEIPVYEIALDRLTDSASLLDLILQIQQKGRWSENGKKATNNYGTWLCDDYQVTDFITVVDMLCKYYMKNEVDPNL